MGAWPPGVSAMSPLAMAEAANTYNLAGNRSDVINPRLFGAKGNANPLTYTGTEDQRAINDAISYAASLGGGTVELDAGYYLIGISSGSAGIAMLSSVRFIGRGGWLLLKPNTAAHVINATGQSNYQISGLFIDGNKANQDAAQNTHGIRNNTCTDYEVSHNFIKNVCQYSISEDIVQRVLIAFNQIQDSGADGIDVHNSNLDNNGLVIMGNRINGFGTKATSKAGIHGRGKGLIVKGNWIFNGSNLAGLHGISMGNGETIYGQIAEGNYVEMGATANAASAIVTNNPNSIVANNICICTATTLDVIAINGADNVVTGNQIQGAASRDGIAIKSGSPRTQVSNNKINGVAGDGIDIADVDCVVTDNTAVSCGGAACHIVTGVTNTKLRGMINSACTGGRLNDQGTLTIDYDNFHALTDGITAPATISGQALIYVDTADGDLKVKFGDGTVKTIVVDT